MKLFHIFKSLLKEEVDVNWLYKWYSNVPDEKIRNTFSYVTFNTPSNTNLNPFKVTSYNKQQILNILKKNVKMVSLDRDFINKNFIIDGRPLFDSNMVAFYLDSGAIGKLEPYFNYLKKLSLNGKSVKFFKKELDSLEITINSVKKYGGNIILPTDYKQHLSGKSNATAQGAVAHEQNHLLFDLTKNSAVAAIRKICDFKNSVCGDSAYKNHETEIYSYLMTIREKFKLQPTDVIKNIGVKFVGADAVITIIVNRNNQVVNLTDRLNKKSATYGSMLCCSGSFSKSLMNLHNSVAVNNKDSNSTTV